MSIHTRVFDLQIERGYIYLRLFNWEFERIRA